MINSQRGINKAPLRLLLQSSRTFWCPELPKPKRSPVHSLGNFWLWLLLQLTKADQHSSILFWIFINCLSPTLIPYIFWPFSYRQSFFSKKQRHQSRHPQSTVITLPSSKKVRSIRQLSIFSFCQETILNGQNCESFPSSQKVPSNHQQQPTKVNSNHHTNLRKSSTTIAVNPCLRPNPSS